MGCIRINKKLNYFPSSFSLQPSIPDSCIVMLRTRKKSQFKEDSEHLRTRDENDIQRVLDENRLEFDRKTTNNLVCYELMTTRFTNETFEQYQRYKNNHQIEGSLYNVAYYLRFNTVKLNVPMIVLEMNNTQNKLMGMGLILNQFQDMNKHDIYTDTNYNRYTYQSKYHISFMEHSHDWKYVEDTKQVKKVIGALETICFFGKTHIKRGTSFTRVPTKLMSKYEYYIVKKSLHEWFKMKYIDACDDENNIISKISWCHDDGFII